MSEAPLVYGDDTIRRILSGVRSIALVGASPKEQRPSYFVLKYLLGKGFRVIPVNPGHAGREILGQATYASLSEIPEPIDMVDIFRASAAVPAVVEEALALDPVPKVVWMQLGVRNETAAETARAAGLEVVMDRCPKIEYARLAGEIGWNGINSRILSSRKPSLRKGVQSYGLNPTRR